jgi:uncharacterized protein DUF4340
MRGVRSLIVLVIIAIPLGWYALRESKREPSSDAKKLEKVFGDVQQDKIDRLTVKSESGDRTTVEKKGGEWQLTQPVSAKADEGAVSGIASNLSTLEMQRVVDDQASDFKQYGLDPPRIDIVFKTGAQERKLAVGQKTPTGTDLYARVPGSPRVFLISSFLDTTLNKSTFDLRDKTILKFDREKVGHLEIATPDQTIVFVKEGADWRITAPIDARADFGTIEGIIGKLNTTQMKALPAPQGGDPKEYGLDKPAVTVRLSAGSATAALEFGKEATQGSLYARDLSRPMVFTVESLIVDDLKKKPDDFRVKDIFDARSFNTTRVEIVRGGQTITFEKQKDTWKQVAPAAKNVDSTKMEGLLTAFTNARANSFVDSTADTGLDAPELTVTAKFEDGQKQERVKLGRHGGDAFAQRDGEAGAAKIDAATLDAITKALDALK